MSRIVSECVQVELFSAPVRHGTVTSPAPGVFACATLLAPEYHTNIPVLVQWVGVTMLAVAKSFALCI